MNTYHPDLLLAGVPTTDEFQHQFLGLVLDQAPERRGQPGLRRRRPQRRARRPGRAAGGVHPHGLPGGGRDPDAGARPRGRQPGHVRLVGPRLRAAVPRDRRQQAARRPRPAVQAPDVELPHGGGGDHRVGEGLLGGRCPADLPQRRRPRSGQRRAGRAVQADRGGRRRRDRHQDPRGVQGARRSQRLDPRRQARGLEGHRPDLHQGASRATSRTAPTAPPTWPIPPGRATSSCSPIRRTSSTRRRRARSIAPSHFFGQHGYVPDVQNLGAAVNMRATFLAGGPGIAKGEVTARTIDLAPDAVLHPRHPRAPAEPGPGADRAAQGRQLDQADLHRRPQRLPRSARPDDGHRGQQHQRPGRRRVVPGHDVRRGARRRCPARASSWPAATTSGPRPRTPGCSTTCRRSTSRTRGASTPRPTATTSSTTASTG